MFEKVVYGEKSWNYGLHKFGEIFTAFLPLSSRFKTKSFQNVEGFLFEKYNDNGRNGVKIWLKSCVTHNSNFSHHILVFQTESKNKLCHF